MKQGTIKTLGVIALGTVAIIAGGGTASAVSSAPVPDGSPVPGGSASSGDSASSGVPTPQLPSASSGAPTPQLPGKPAANPSAPKPQGLLGGLPLGNLPGGLMKLG
ncbi:ATP-binding protein [Streptomyces sp. NPDC005355]|uniref:ATP-binding protein n=1 Tax=Streptomyces sp. NPDC005355 TaxID=3157038 RepID=UPI0033B4F0DB